MTLAEFQTRLLAALQAHFPDAKLHIEEKRGVTVNIRADIGAGKLIQVYFSGLTGKTSYALVYHGQRVLGYDNRLFWHRHPYHSPAEHQACAEPAPEDVMAEMHDLQERQA